MGIFRKGGCDIKDPRTLKIVSMAADKFLADVINEAKEINTIRKTKAVKRKSSSTVSSLEMVSPSLLPLQLIA